MLLRTFGLSALLLSLTWLPPAHAQNQTGFGVSATIGPSKIEDTDDGDTFDGSAFGFSVEAEYRFTPYFALGAGGFSLGTADDTFNGVDTEIEASAFGVFSRLIYPVSDTVDIYGRLGGVIYRTNVEPDGLAAVLDSLFGEEAVEVGLGIDFGRTERIAFRLEGRYFNGSDEERGALLQFGFNYLF